MVSVREHSSESEKKKYFHAFPWRRLSQELSFPADQHYNGKWNQRRQSDREKKNRSGQQEHLASIALLSRQPEKRSDHRYKQGKIASRDDGARIVASELSGTNNGNVSQQRHPEDDNN